MVCVAEVPCSLEILAAGIGIAVVVEGEVVTGTVVVLEAITWVVENETGELCTDIGAMLFEVEGTITCC